MAQRRLTSITPVRDVDPAEYSEEQISVLVRLYTQRGDRILELLRRESLTDFQRERSRDILRQIAAQLSVLNAAADRFAAKSTPVVYKKGFELSKKIAREFSITKDVNFGSRINTRTVDVLAKQIAIDLKAGNASIQRQAERYVRATQQRVVEDAAISQTIAEGSITGAARRTVSDALYRQFADKLGDGKLIEINGRGYDPASYSELVARTRMREAASQGTLNGALQYGMDLVQIDVHGDACPICQTRMGRVYSISGKHPDFPVLDAKPPFHPNCRCILSVTSEDRLRTRGTYDASVALSNKPRFLDAREAKAWLAENPSMSIVTVKDYENFIRSFKAKAA